MVGYRIDTVSMTLTIKHQRNIHAFYGGAQWDTKAPLTKVEDVMKSRNDMEKRAKAYQ